MKLKKARAKAQRTPKEDEDEDTEVLNDQLNRLKRAVSFNSYDMAIRQIIDMVETGLIDIAPEYQRHFVWKEQRESELIESVLLGIPIPNVYMATNNDGTWEVVDGVQRISTLLHFVGGAKLLKKIGKREPLKIIGLQKLTALNGLTFDQLPQPQQFQFQTRPLRLTALNDKSDPIVRYDLFERLNTGGVSLHPQEIRNCVFRGPFKDILKDLSKDKEFRKVYRPRNTDQREADLEEAVLRFFAFLERYRSFGHIVNSFLNDYMVERNKTPADQRMVQLFHRTMKFLSGELPDGVRRKQTTSPTNLYEAVAVGCALALQKKPTLPTGRIARITASDDLAALTTGGTNSRKMVRERIELVRDRMLA